MAQSNPMTTELPPFPCSEGVTFRHLPNWPGYAVGSDGSVWSCRKRGKGEGYHDRWHRRQTMFDRDGYYELTFYTAGKVIRRKVHVLILEAFHGPRPDGLEGCHTNGIRTDNRPENLRWDTPASNYADRNRHGSLKGERNGRAKLTVEQVRAIRAEYVYRSVTAGTPALARKYGLNQKTVFDIITGHHWPDA